MSIVLIQAQLFDRANIGTDEQVADLLAQINEIKFEPSMPHSNDGCWRSIHKYTNIEWLYKEIVDLAKEATEFYASIDPQFTEFSKNKKYNLHQWTNVNQPESINVIHSHVGANFSCVYYVQSKDTGDLVFSNPANVLHNCNANSPFVKDIFFKPKDKDLILWPSWMPHAVERNSSNKERINLTFDIRLE